jgi:biotin synthase
VKTIKKEIGIDICTSLGFITEEEALALKNAGVNRYNHNLNASERFYPNICSTHSFQDRVQTLRNARAAGLELCCGALFGMGERDEDIIDTLLALREIKPDSIPINFFNPIKGTPLENTYYLTPLKCLKILCLTRFLNPRIEVRAAGGREYHLRSLQPLTLYPVNSLFVSGYLTTTGQTPEEAWKMIEDMGFDVEEERSVEVATQHSKEIA